MSEDNLSYPLHYTMVAIFVIVCGLSLIVLWPVLAIAFAIARAVFETLFG